MSKKHAHEHKTPEKGVNPGKDQKDPKENKDQPSHQPADTASAGSQAGKAPEVSEPELLEPFDAEQQEAAEPAPDAAPSPADELKGQLLRLRADFENFRKRTRREKEEWTTRSLEHICGDLLTVLDHFELGLKNAEDLKVSSEVLKGFSLVNDQLKSVLGKYGLNPVNADAAFDPNLHEAISYVASPEVPADHVLAMTRRGYKLGERLLRPAQVVVSQGPPEEPAASEAIAEETSLENEAEGKTEEN